MHYLGELDSCESLTPGVLLDNSFISSGHFKRRAASSFSECVNICLENIKCEAIAICKSCRYLECFMFRYSKEKSAYARHDVDYQSAIFPAKIATILELTGTNIKGNPRSSNRIQSIKVQTECRDICIEDAYCVAYTFCECPNKVERCQLYTENGINGLKGERGSQTYFINSRREIADELASSTFSPGNQTTNQP